MLSITACKCNIFHYIFLISTCIFSRWLTYKMCPVTNRTVLSIYTIQYSHLNSVLGIFWDSRKGALVMLAGSPGTSSAAAQGRWRCQQPLLTTFCQGFVSRSWESPLGWWVSLYLYTACDGQEVAHLAWNTTLLCLKSAQCYNKMQFILLLNQLVGYRLWWSISCRGIGLQYCETGLHGDTVAGVSIQ